jgi:hypothetical protein
MWGKHFSVVLELCRTLKGEKRERRRKKKWRRRKKKRKARPCKS